jgi:hypothetical protein
MAWPIWRRLLPHFTRLAFSLARLSEGSRIETSNAMMPITTSSSTRVKPWRRLRFIRSSFRNIVEGAII